jgi:hypothetical protein
LLILCADGQQDILPEAKTTSKEEAFRIQLLPVHPVRIFNKEGWRSRATMLI